MVQEHELEPVWGLPERPPAGEVILWQGAPDWRVHLRRGLHLRGFALYFGALLGARCIASLAAGASLPVALRDAAWFLPFVAAVLALILLLAVLVARTSAYTITSRRIVFRIGIALSMTVNIPFTAIEGAALRRHADGSGDITLAISLQQRISYIFFWPHVRPWRYARPEPALRAIPNVDAVAQTLSRALAAAAAVPVQPVAVTAPAGAASGPQTAAA
ncbi:PH domain-containing protein [Belnapia sp. T6]|uniref:PH domain-containing protein n=1 Tax=Belnapia mucosa TaxID=2804532 RepID=A0ABS1V1U8_9PROT|nr:photosynthetic complex putative assembly protein PuhB [Belnapia mucosa]MBL6455671.1 PH domain-containing protein [Belnapia mucosa]